MSATIVAFAFYYVLYASCSTADRKHALGVAVFDAERIYFLSMILKHLRSIV